MNWIKPDWPVANNIHAATSLRAGGTSHGVYETFNLALHVGDNPETVLSNRVSLLQMLALPSEPIWLDQVHSNRVIDATKSAQLQQADASFTKEAGIVSVVMTADCLPILLASYDGKRVAAIHAGWRGLLAGIIGNTVANFDASNTIAWLGPAIGPDCFDVGRDVQSSFITKSGKFSTAFIKKNEHKFLADIYQLATIELAALGVTQVYGGGFCTSTDKQRFYSYRRDGETGRMATLIWRD